MVMSSVSEGNGLRIKHKIHSEKLIFHKKKIPKTSNAHIQTSKQNTDIRRKLIQPCEKKEQAGYRKHTCVATPLSVFSHPELKIPLPLPLFFSQDIFFFSLFTITLPKNPHKKSFFFFFRSPENPKIAHPSVLRPPRMTHSSTVFP